VANARVEPKGNAILVTKQVSGSAKIDPLGSVDIPDHACEICYC
jgi:phage terminase large subunit-like protein